MSTQEQVEAARQKMNEAHDALLAYINRPASVPANDALHKQLAEAFKRAHREYGNLVAELE